MYFRSFAFVLAFASCWSSNNFRLYGQSFTLSGVSDLIQIFEDGYNEPSNYDTINVFGIRGEIISGQCVLKAEENLTDVSVEVEALYNQTTGSIIPAGFIESNFVGNIPLTENAPNQPLQAVVRAAPARFPDYLMAEKQIKVPEGMCQAIWLTIQIPETTEAGTYTGSITVKSSHGERSLPLSLKVYPLNLPHDRHLKIAEWFSTRNFEKFHGIKEMYSDEWFEMLGKYAENLVKHRQNVFQVPMNSIVIRLFENGKMDFDFSRFDQIAQVFWDTEKMDYLETGELTKFGEEAWFSTEILFKDFIVKNMENGEQITMEGKEVIPFLLPAFENHLRKKGWLDKTLFHVKDEPTLRNVMAWKKVSSLIHQYAPDLIRIDAIETTFLFDEIEIAIPKLDYLAAWYDVYEKAAQDGTELWFYTVGIYQASQYPNKTIDMPLMDNRILHWLNYKYDLSGFLHWGWNQWYTENPFEEVGMHIGDGWHVYPVKNGILNSLRWEQMRNGIQDYEYFWMLEDKIRNLRDSLGSRFAWIDPKQRGKEIAGGVVKDFLEHTDDPQVLYQAKEEVINEMLKFETSPRIYVQTNPKVHSSTVKERSYLVEVFGWAESGTKVTVNGEELTLNDQGMFLRNLKLSREENSVIVEAGNKQGTKRIVREFDVIQ